MSGDDEWIRDGGRVCLDFVNTLRDRWKEPYETLRTPDDLVRWLRDSGLLVDLSGPSADGATATGNAAGAGSWPDDATDTKARDATTQHATTQHANTQHANAQKPKARNARAAGGNDAALRSARVLREAIDRATLAVAADRLPAAEDVRLINEVSADAPRPALRLVVADGRLEPEQPVGLARDTAAGLGLVAQDAVELLLSAEARRVRICGSDRCALRFVDRSPAHNRRWCSMARCGNRTKVRLHQARARATA